MPMIRFWILGFDVHPSFFFRNERNEDCRERGRRARVGVGVVVVVVVVVVAVNGSEAADGERRHLSFRHRKEDADGCACCIGSVEMGGTFSLSPLRGDRLRYSNATTPFSRRTPAFASPSSFRANAFSTLCTYARSSKSHPIRTCSHIPHPFSSVVVVVVVVVTSLTRVHCPCVHFVAREKKQRPICAAAPLQKVPKYATTSSSPPSRTVFLLWSADAS